MITEEQENYTLFKAGNPLLQAKVSYKQPGCDEVHETELIANNLTEDAKLVDTHRNRKILTTALDTANLQVEEGELRAARTTLEEAIKKIQTSISAESEICKKLISDLEEALSKMQDEAEYSRGGAQLMYASQSLHASQSQAPNTPYATPSVRKTARLARGSVKRN